MEVKLTSSCQMNKCLMLTNKLNYNNKFLKVVKKKNRGIEGYTIHARLSKLQNICA